LAAARGVSRALHVTTMTQVRAASREQGRYAAESYNVETAYNLP
jgi:hypothetical protein